MPKYGSSCGAGQADTGATANTADAGVLEYYAAHSRVTGPGRYGELLDDLPCAVSTLAGVIVGLVLHPAAAAKSGMSLSPARRAELDLRYVPRMLERVLALDPRPLSEERPTERRLIGNCRDAAVLLCSVLRQQVRPARARNGFATYLAPGFLTDHWICEYWDAQRGRWIAVDPGFPPDRASTGFDFDTLDVPPDRFLNAGRTWLAYRRGELDAARCGLPGRDDNGVGWIASQVVRDLASLNKREMLAWDTWALGRSAFDGVSREDAALLDRVATLTAAARNDEVRDALALYRREARLTVPPIVHTLDHAAGGEPVRSRFETPDDEP